MTRFGLMQDPYIASVEKNVEKKESVKHGMLCKYHTAARALVSLLQRNHKVQQEGKPPVVHYCARNINNIEK